MFLNSIFKVMTLSLVVVLSKIGAIVIIAIYCLLLSVILKIIEKHHSVGEEVDWTQQRFECNGLSFLTVTNLENTRAARLCRQSFSILICYQITDLGLYPPTTASCSTPSCWS